MKFNVKLDPVPGEEPENTGGSRASEPGTAKDEGGPDAGASPMKRMPRIVIPPTGSEGEARESVAEEPIEAEPEPVAIPVDPHAKPADGPVQLSAGGDEDAFFDDFFGDDEEAVEADVSAYEVDASDYDSVEEPDLETQWEDLLSDDETYGAPAGEPVGVRAQEEPSWANPLLDEDEDDDEVFTGEAEAKGSAGEGAANPLLDEDDDEEGLFTGEGGVSAPAPAPGAPAPPSQPARPAKRIVVPPKPELSEQDAEALQRREEAQQAASAARTKAVPAGAPDEQDNQTGLERRISYEVTVDETGRERAERKRARPAKPVAAGEAPEASAEPVEVLDPEGRKKWVARTDAGRLSPNQLSVFKNLNRASSSPEAEEAMRELFTRAGEKIEDPAAARRRKKLANRAVFGMESVGAGSRKRFTEKDREVLRFIGMFKYANARHIARIHQVKEDTALKRLYALQDRGLVLKKELYGAKPLWYLTEGGLICSGLEVPRVKESGITYSMLPHQFVVNHIAGNLWGAGVNVLALEDFPDRFRRTESGTLALGESLVSEYEIQSSFASAKAANHKADVYRPAIMGAMNREFTRWAQAGKPVEGSPEFTLGNEYMWTLFPPFALKLAYHVPDLVIKRPRNEDGSPNSIAVEVELANKPIASYERTLNAFKYDSLIYGKVVWVVKSRGAARKIQEAAKKIGTWAEGRVGIVPIYTEDGVFKGKAEWTI